MEAFPTAAAMLALCACIGLPAPVAAAPESPAGLWFTKNDKSIIKLAPCGAFFCGVVIWMKEPNDPDGKPRTDKFNEDEAKRGRPLVGVEIFKKLAPDEDRWRGKAYNPEDGKTYDITFKVIADKAGGDRAEIEGCVLKILCKTDVLTRAQGVPKPPSPQP